MSHTSPNFDPHRPIFHLPFDLVIGHIRWSKALGLPSGDITKAFDISCYTHERVPGGSPSHPVLFDRKVPHDVAVSEGTHDDEFYRLVYLTDSQWSLTYKIGEPFRTQNFIDVSFHDGVVWPPTVTINPGLNVIHLIDPRNLYSTDSSLALIGTAHFSISLLTKRLR